MLNVELEDTEMDHALSGKPIGHRSRWPAELPAEPDETRRRRLRSHGHERRQEVITLLNQVLKNELTAISQVFPPCAHVPQLGPGETQRLPVPSIDTGHVKEADELIERVLFLEGLPNLQSLGKLLIGENPVHAWPPI